MEPALRFALKPLVRDIRSVLKHRKWSEGLSPDPSTGYEKRNKLYKGIAQRTQRFRDGNVFGTIGFIKRDIKRHYAHAIMAERGTDPHTIVAGQFRGRRTGKRTLVGPPPKKRPRKLFKNGKNNFGPIVKHPGAKPVFYMRNTYEDGRSRMGTAFIQELKRRIPAALTRYAKSKFRSQVRKQFGSGARFSVANAVQLGHPVRMNP